MRGALVLFLSLSIAICALPALAIPQPPIESEDISQDGAPQEAPQDGWEQPQEGPVDAWGETDKESDLERLLRRAEERFAEDDLEGAIDLYRHLADRHDTPEKKVDTLMTVAWLEHLMGRERGGGDLAAVETLTTALSLVREHSFRAELYNDRFRDLYLEAQRQALAERQTLASDAMVRAGEQMRSGDYDAARRLYDEALEHQEDLPEALYNRALVDLYLDRADDALDGFQRILALAQNPDRGIDDRMQALALTNLGYVFTTRSDNEQAAEALDEAVRLAPDYAPAWSNLGVARRRLGQKVDAATAFRRAHELEPEDPGIMSNLGLAYLDAEDWIAAVALYKKATGVDGGNPGLWVNLGRAQIGMSNPDGANESFERAILEDSDNGKGFAFRAAVQLARQADLNGDAEETLRQADRALTWDQSKAEAWIFRGLGLKGLGRLEEARSAFDSALQIDPAEASVHNNLGSVLYELGDLNAAEKSFQRALEIQPNLVNAQQNLNAVRQARTQGTAQPLPSSRSTRSTRSTTRPAAPPPKPAPPSPPPPPPPPSLGVSFADIDYSGLGLRGLMIETVESGSAAEAAGLRANDLLLKIDGVDVSAQDTLRTYVAGRPAGSKVVVDLLRNNIPTRIEIDL